MSRIVVLGGAESGVGAAVLAKVKGFDVFLSDKGKIADHYADMLKEWDIPFEQGQHSEELTSIMSTTHSQFKPISNLFATSKSTSPALKTILPANNTTTNTSRNGIVLTDLSPIL